MEERDYTTLRRMGLFMAIGLAAVAGVVVYFGRLGDGLRRYYEIRVEYPNASGLLRGASVLLAGAKIGMVKTAPQILDDMKGVFVILRIYEEVKIPSASEFRVGSSGLLGDRFVEIVLLPGALTSAPIKPGATIRGRGETGGFGALAESAADMMDDIEKAVRNINSISAKIDREVLTEKTLADLMQTLDNLQRATSTIVEASSEISLVVKQAEGAFEQARGTISQADGALRAGQAAAEEFRRTMSDIRALVNEARRGKGLVPTLLSDKAIADNFRALAQNLRERGILWYRNAAKKSTPARQSP